MNKYIWCILGIAACIWLVGLRDVIMFSLLMVVCEVICSRWRE